VLLLDLAMPETTGFDALRLLSKTGTQTRILLLTAGVVRSEIPAALKLGARGVLLKDADADVLFQAIRAVYDGQLWVRREVIDDLLAGPPAGGNGRSASKGENKFGLTKRELELVGLVASGRSNKEIAALCSLREDTVKHHLSSIFDKTGVSSRLELALFAINNRIV
jgi:DNA-binding NarL/FixJ family response regulator